MSLSTWTTTEVASSAQRITAQPWRAVEAQHRVSTMSLVDSLAEQAELEALLETSKLPVPAPALGLHWLLFTPFRYPTSRYGSRFRRPFEPGVFYSADEQRTACAELGYWRWRFLSDSPALTDISSVPQTLFQTSVDALAVDIRAQPFAQARDAFMTREDHSYCQAFAVVAREAALEAIVHASVRDPEAGRCIGVLAPRAFSRKEPIAQETWMLSVTRERVVWQRSDVLRPAAFEFQPSEW
jgi:hypothetical protein